MPIGYCLTMHYLMATSGTGSGVCLVSHERLLLTNAQLASGCFMTFSNQISIAGKPIISISSEANVFSESMILMGSGILFGKKLKMRATGDSWQNKIEQSRLKPSS